MECKIPTHLELLKAGVHFGHQTSKWYPKMAPYIYGVRNEIHIIDLEQTQKKLEEACRFAQKVVTSNGQVLFIGTKRQGQGIVRKYAEACGMPFVTERWLGGTITNYVTIHRLIKSFTKMKREKATGGFDKYNKKEQLVLTRKIEDHQKMIGGIESLSKIPEAVFVLDVRKEKTAMKEARKRGIKIIAICDTNVNPEGVDYVIPANDDATRSIEILLKTLSDAIAAAKTTAPKVAPAVVATPSK